MPEAIATACGRSQQAEQQHEKAGDGEGEQDRPQATQTVGEEEEHLLTLPTAPRCTLSGSFFVMCRSIKTLRGQAEITDEEVAAAALQFVRKVSGYRLPSRANQSAFESAVAEVAASTSRLLEAVGSPPQRAGHSSG